MHSEVGLYTHGDLPADILKAGLLAVYFCNNSTKPRGGEATTLSCHKEAGASIHLCLASKRHKCRGHWGGELGRGGCIPGVEGTFGFRSHYQFKDPSLDTDYNRPP